MTTPDSVRAAWLRALQVGARQLGVPLTAAQAGACWQLALALRERNSQVNLTAIDDLDAMRGLHFLDSLAIVPHLGAAQRVLDVGTGGGFPGLPLAIACPERQFTLIDGTQKKIRFVLEAIGLLGLTNATAFAARAEGFKSDARFDVVIVRAVGQLADLARLCRPLLARDGRLLALKGKRPDEELAALPLRWRAEVTPLHVPEVDAERHLVTLRYSGDPR